MRQKGNIMDRRVRLKAVNSYVTCTLCKGYLIDATTITECLHTFCKSCIVKYLEKNNKCPKCELVIHQSHPLNYISHDRTMQDIVYKLVPNLQEDELKRERHFYKKRGLPMPEHLTQEATDENGLSEEDGENNNRSDDPSAYHRADEQVNLCLESTSLKHLNRQFLRCSAFTTITHLKKFIAHKIFSDMQRFKEIELFCNEEILGKDHTLKFVCVTRWRYKDIPLKLNYRPKVELCL